MAGHYSYKRKKWHKGAGQDDAVLYHVKFNRNEVAIVDCAIE
jgi:hypothetical protein